MRRPFNPTIRHGEDCDFVVDEPDQPARLIRDPSTGELREAQESPGTVISKMLMTTLRETAARPTVSPARIPAHLRRYVT